jgi:hypothetical protein
VEVIGHEEASAKEVVAEFVSLFFGEAPLADLNGVEPWPVVDLVTVVEIDALFDGASVDAGEATDGGGEGTISAGKVLGPEGEALLPRALEAGVVAVEWAGRVHETGEAPLGGALVVRREWIGFVAFNRRVRAEGSLRIKHTEEDDSCEGKRAA